MGLSAPTIRALHEGFGYRVATGIQESAIPPALTGQDLLAQARTGTGKTIAFLIPAIERLVASGRCGPRRQGIGVLVLSPTRELADQTLGEARQLLKHHSPEMTAGIVMGGTNMRSEASRLARGVDVLVATPGRYLDHVKSTPRFAAAVGSVQVLIMDECDRLLDMGFMPDVRRIMATVPPPGARQTLLFSATVPDTVKQVSREALTPSHAFVSTVPKNAVATHEIVLQEAAAAPYTLLLPTLFRALRHHVSIEPEYKVIVFFPTGARHPCSPPPLSPRFPPHPRSFLPQRAWRSSPAPSSAGWAWAGACWTFTRASRRARACGRRRSLWRAPAWCCSRRTCPRAAWTTPT